MSVTLVGGLDKHYWCYDCGAFVAADAVWAHGATHRLVVLENRTPTDPPAPPSGYPSDSVVVVLHGADAAANGLNLLAAYTAACALTPGGAALSATNRAALLIPPGTYLLPAGVGWAINTDYVDVIGWPGSVESAAAGVTTATPTVVTDTPIVLSFTNARVAGFHTVGVAGTFGAADAIWQVSGTTLADGAFEDLSWTDSSGGLGLRAVGVDAAGGTVGAVWRNCHTQMPGFLSSIVAGAMVVGGLHIECSAGNGSFAGRHAGVAGASTYSGVALNCRAGQYSFAGSFPGGAVVMSGKILNGYLSNYSVAASVGAAAGDATFSGEVRDCTLNAPSYALGYSEGAGVTVEVTNTARITNVVAGGSVFAVATGASPATFAGTAVNCVATASNAFGASHTGVGTFSGVARGCVAVDFAFGVSYNAASAANAVCSGTLQDCIASNGRSFACAVGSGNATFSGFAQGCLSGSYGFAMVFGVGTASFEGRAVGCGGYTAAVDYLFGVAFTTGTGSIAATAQLYDCFANNYSFGVAGTTGAGTVVALAFLKGCYARDFVFGATGGAGVATFAGRAENCSVRGSGCFGMSAGGVASFTGLALNCYVVGNEAFGSSRGAVGVTYSGVATGCVCQGVTGKAFGFSTGGNVVWSGRADDCATVGNYSFGSTDGGGGSVTISGTMQDCVAGTYSFGAIKGDITAGTGTLLFQATARVQGCVATTQSFGFSSAQNPGAVTVTSGATFADCKGGNQCFGSLASTAGITDAGTYQDCTAGDDSFGTGTHVNSGVSILNGTYVQCVAGSRAFGSNPRQAAINASARFLSCRATEKAFGYSSTNYAVNCDATFTDCAVSGSWAFGYSETGSAACAGTFYGCSAGGWAFAAQNGAAAAATFSGKAYNCTVGNTGYAFGVTTGSGTATFSGIAQNCTVGATGGNSYAFGCAVGTGAATFSGTARNCTAGYRAFGSALSATTVTWSGAAYACSSAGYAFGHSVGGAVTWSGTAEDCVVTGTGGFARSETGGNGKITLTATARMLRCAAKGASFCSSSRAAGGYIGELEVAAGAIIDGCTNDGNGGFVATDANTAGSNCLFAGTIRNCVSSAYSFVRCPGGAGDTTTVAATARVENCHVLSDTASAASFAVSEVGSLSIAAGAYFENCTVRGGADCFGSKRGSAGTNTINGTFVRCGVRPGATNPLNNAFGYGNLVATNVGGTFIDCTANDSSFGSAAGGAAVTFSGVATRCMAGTDSFGKDGILTAAARLMDCTALQNSFGVATGAAACVLTRCVCSGITADANAPVFDGAYLDGCKFIATGAGPASPVLVRTGGTLDLADCQMYSVGAAPGVGRPVGAGVATITMRRCDLNVDIDATITNSIGAGYNVVDAAIVVRV